MERSRHEAPEPTTERAAAVGDSPRVLRGGFALVDRHGLSFTEADHAAAEAGVGRLRALASARPEPQSPGLFNDAALSASRTMAPMAPVGPW